MIQRIRQTRYKTSDGQMFDEPKLARDHERKLVVLSELLQAAQCLHIPATAVNYDEWAAVAETLITSKAIMIVTVTQKEVKL